MAIIVDFKPSDPPSRELQPRSSSMCEIILFPGVRYERWDVASPPTPQAEQSQSPSRKRRAKKRVAEMAE